jgi:hypothetical protein
LPPGNMFRSAMLAAPCILSSSNPSLRPATKTH